MPLDIRPTIDFAFKKVFGDPKNSSALVALLNAILDLADPIESIEILNPFNYQEFEGAKQIVLDVRARDQVGRWLNVEMQISGTNSLQQRLLYYACSMYVDQLSRGQDYSGLASAISVCLVNQEAFPRSPQRIHRFEMAERESGGKLNNGVEIHIVELAKYNLDETALRDRSDLEYWIFFFLRSHLYEPNRLRELLPGSEFELAIETLEQIKRNTKDKLMYDQREKAIRDYESSLRYAHQQGLEQGLQQGLERGLEQGLEQGLELGLEQGMEQGLVEGLRLGADRGKILGRILMLQEIMKVEVASESELATQSDESLLTLLAALQRRFDQT